MTPDFSPRALFLSRQSADAKALRAAVNSEWFHQAATHALAEMAGNGAVSREHLDGAHLFLETFATLADAKATAPQFPTRNVN